MADYKIIVTDVTCYGSLYCVAGWDRNTHRMIRPEPPGASTANEASRFWDVRFVGPGKLFDLGCIAEFYAADPLPDFPFPHATEDRIVDMTRPRRSVERLDMPQIVQAVAAGVSPTLEDAFDGGLVRVAGSRKPYVQVGHVGRSLGAIELAPRQIAFQENTFDPSKRKLRANLSVGGLRYDLSVTAEAVRARWLAGGLSALRADVEASKRIHLRVGLSRPFRDKPDQCFLQVNGVYFL